jgi:LytR cell envelope-related transcriptional attenuator
MSGPPADGGPADDPTGPPPDHGGRPRAGLGLALVVVAVVIGVLLLPSATRPPLAVSAAPTSSTTTVPRTHGHGSTTTTTTIAPADIHVLVANATTVNGVAGRVTTFLGTKGFATLTATNAVGPKVAASEIYAIGGATADTAAVAAALGLPAANIAPVTAAPPVPTAAGANVVVVVGPDLAARFPLPAAG